VRIWNYILSGNSNNYISMGETLRIEEFAIQLRRKDAKHTFLWLGTKQLIKMYGVFVRSLAWLWRKTPRPLKAFLKITLFPQLLKELLTFYGTRRFITEYTRVRHFPCPESIEPSPLHFVLVFQTHFSIFLSSTPGAPLWSLSFRLLYQSPLCIYNKSIEKYETWRLVVHEKCSRP
jgi:hypothetical protein